MLTNLERLVIQRTPLDIVRHIKLKINYVENIFNAVNSLYGLKNPRISVNKKYDD